jgi:hypothetical protein
VGTEFTFWHVLLDYMLKTRGSQGTTECFEHELQKCFLAIAKNAGVIPVEYGIGPFECLPTDDQF